MICASERSFHEQLAWLYGLSTCAHKRSATLALDCFGRIDYPGFLIDDISNGVGSNGVFQLLSQRAIGMDSVEILHGLSSLCLADHGVRTYA